MAEAADIEVPAYKRTIELASRLTPDEKQRLLEWLTQQLKSNEPPRNPKGFRGIWRARFPEDIDIEDCLRKIRNESKRELEEIA